MKMGPLDKIGLPPCKQEVNQQNTAKDSKWQTSSGPLYTTAKGHDHDHEIVTALETHPQAVPWKIEIEGSWGFKCSVKDISHRTLNQMLFHYHPIHVAPSTHKL